MFNPPVIIAVCCLYLTFLFMIAIWVERKAAAGTNIGDNALIYALSLTVYNTAWTFYGSVGKAASTGMLFLAIHLGPTLAIVLGWVILRKMVRIKNAYRVTSIADFVSLRYNKSASIAALVTVIAIVGLVPYTALQLKAVISTFGIITGFPDSAATPRANEGIGLIITGVIILFTIVLGVRRLVPTERHQGIVVAIAAEGVVKLIALLAVGSYVTYGLFGGFGDIFRRWEESPFSSAIASVQTTPSFYLTWTTYLVLAMSAVMFLPRQFHLAVVENFNEKHIQTAMWLFPLYMLLIDIFILPIAMGGLLAGYPAEMADGFVLRLPLSSGKPLLSLLVFLGGFSAATGMITITSMTISTMVTNHLLLPLVESVKPLGFIKRYLLQCRWIAVAVLILAGYWFARNVGPYFQLVDIGIISFTAVLQFAPAIIGGLFWKRGNAVGALFGMGSGFLLWIYTLVLPAFVTGGFVSRTLVDEGPAGVGILRPEHLLGVNGLDPASHAVLWTMLLNVSLYILGSLYAEQGEEERGLSADFVDALSAAAKPVPLAVEATIDQAVKRRSVEALFDQYFPAAKAAELARHCLTALQIDDKHSISIIELAELHNEAERYLAGSIGAAAAHKAIHLSAIMTPAEESALKQIYADIIAELRMPPSDLITKIDYYREKERLLTAHAAELEDKIRERDQEITERRTAEEALRNSERQLADIIDFLPDATFAIDLEGKIILWNRAAEEFTGAKAADMLGKGDREYAIPFYGVRRPILIDLVFTPSEEAKRLYPQVVIENGIVMGESPTRNVKRGEGYMLGIAAPLFDSEGQLIGAIESVRDITERKEIEQMKDEMISAVSHEMRTPLTAMMGYAEFMLGTDVPLDQQKEYLQIILRETERLNELIGNFLDLQRLRSRGPALTCLPLALQPLLEETIALFGGVSQRHHLTLDCPPDLPKICGNDKHLRQVFNNLVSNAEKYSPKGGEVRVTARREKDSVVVTVSDEGIGIPPQALDKIFERFYRVDNTARREFGGTGLGLSLVREIVAAHGGKVWVESTLGKGSTFFVSLPVA